MLRLLEKRCEALEGRRAELLRLKRQSEQVVLPALLDLPLSEPAFLEQKRALAAETAKLEESKQEILAMYARLHQAVSPRRPQNFDSSIESRLQEVRMRLKVKREELSAYESLPAGESFQQRRFEMQYAGIEFQQKMLEFCSERKKCFVCSRPLNEAEFRTIKNKCERSVVKVTRKIEELEEENSRRGEEQQVDPHQIIPVLKRDIARAELEEASLASAYDEHAAYKQQTEQAKLNEKLKAALRRAGLDHHPLPAAHAHASA